MQYEAINSGTEFIFDSNLLKDITQVLYEAINSGTHISNWDVVTKIRVIWLVYSI